MKNQLEAFNRFLRVGQRLSSNYSQIKSENNIDFNGTNDVIYVRIKIKTQIKNSITARLMDLEAACWS